MGVSCKINVFGSRRPATLVQPHSLFYDAEERRVPLLQEYVFNSDSIDAARRPGSNPSHGPAECPMSNDSSSSVESTGAAVRPVAGFVSAEAIARLQGLELRARSIVEGATSGGHRSPLRGFSSEFSEHREYAPGDDLRYIDWKVLGRTDRYYVKRFRAETNLACHLLCDVSGSMDYQGPTSPLSKRDYATALSAAIAYLVLKQGDAAGAVAFADREVAAVAPSSSAAHWTAICRTLEFAPIGGPAGVAGAVRPAVRTIGRRAVVVVVSDFFDDAGDLRQMFAELHASGHDVRTMQVIDPAEESFPFTEVTEFHGLEGESPRLVDAAGLAKAYRHEFSAAVSATAQLAKAAGIDHIVARTDEPLDAPLRRLLRNG